MLLIEQKTSLLTLARWLRDHTTLLDMPNPATLLPTAGDGEEHNCVACVSTVCSPRIYMVPLDNPEYDI